MSLLSTSSRCSSMAARCRSAVLPAHRHSSRPLRTRYRIAKKSPIFYRSTAAYQASTNVNIYKGCYHKYQCSRSYTSESTEETGEQSIELPTKDRIPRLPLVITAVSLVPYVAFSVIPFAFPFECVIISQNWVILILSSAKISDTFCLVLGLLVKHYSYK